MKTINRVLSIAVMGTVGAAATVALGAAGCGDPHGDDVPASQLELAAGAPVAIGPALAGYQHVILNSRFALGEVLETRSEHGYHKLVGAHGVFATDEANGAVLAIPDAGAPILDVGPPQGTGEDHNARVVAYFKANGIAADQIGSVSAYPMLGRGGLATALVRPDAPAPKLIAYYSVLNRAVDGIPVADSVAWARFNANGDVVSETVYWPEIPASVVAEAKQLRDDLALPGQASAFRARAAIGGDSDGRVVIRHTSHTWRGKSGAWALYDVNYRIPGERSSYTRHFDKGGVERHLPEELVGRDVPSDPRGGAK
jgi:hypothetical protein